MTDDTRYSLQALDYYLPSSHVVTAYDATPLMDWSGCQSGSLTFQPTDRSPMLSWSGEGEPSDSQDGVE